MAKELTAGDPAPDLSLPDQQGKSVTLKSFRGKQVVLYFYPKDDTPGCTKESCEFRDVESQIVRAGGVILGVSLDDKESHQKFMKRPPSRRPTAATKRKICTERNTGGSSAAPLSLIQMANSRPCSGK